MKKIDKQEFFYENRGFKPKIIKINLADQSVKEYNWKLGRHLKRIYEDSERKLYGEVYE